jgi:BlaI family penicillinase repressor
MPPKISSSEWDIMSVVWAKGRATAAEVFEGLPPGHGWKPKTVNTFLARLVAKGALKVDRSERAHVYCPRIARQDCIRSESESFLRRVFRGATGQLVLHFAQTGELSPEEIRDLETLLKRRKAQK